MPAPTPGPRDKTAPSPCSQGWGGPWSYSAPGTGRHCRTRRVLSCFPLLAVGLPHQTGCTVGRRVWPVQLSWGLCADSSDPHPYLTDGKTEAPTGRELPRGHLRPGHLLWVQPSPYSPGFPAGQAEMESQMPHPGQLAPICRASVSSSVMWGQ